MASSALSTITCSIGRKWFAGLSNHPIVWMIGSSSSSVYSKGMSTLAEPMSTKQNPSSSPWLILPPTFDVTVIGTASLSYKFYNLADNKIVTLYIGKSCYERELTHLHMRLAGSSHGWLALLSLRLDLFLYNPISRRHIKLPLVRDLTIFPASPTIMYKFILSCSPEDPNCRAIIIYNNMYALAFCCPAFSKDWTHISKGYWDCVYSTRHEALFSLTRKGVLESWDLHSLRAVKIADVRRIGLVRIRYPRKRYNNHKEEENDDLRLTCDAVQHLVVAGRDLLVLSQYVACFDFDGLYVDCNDPHQDTIERGLPFFTIDFRVYRYNPEAEDLKYINSLDGLALFVGYHSDAFALPAAEFPELKPNFIYFTNALDDHLVVAGRDLLVLSQYVACFDFDGLYDPEDEDLKYINSLDGLALFVGYHSDAFALPAAEFPELKPNSIYFTNALDDVMSPDTPTGGHDIGIFNYKYKTVLPCSYPCDVKNMSKTFPVPTWFFPKSKHFVAVHGVGHGAWVYYKLKLRVEAADHRFTPLSLAAAGNSPKKLQEVDHCTTIPSHCSNSWTLSPRAKR
ncbi:hypothetical protein STAS_16264 [Striga asiatica]|uniref:KIB1-4 beta-propeller domain-containing protein n=1 Tax=Striga asiatica TaxID=4170 RepID=A0A5A7Q5C6_STRAF|nr:hypothetical protein STAS_16264 [Striga asiatica]